MLSYALPIAASLPDQPGVFEAISYQAVGLIVVFAALGSIWLLMEGMGWIFRGIESRNQQKRAAAVLAAPASPLVPSRSPVGIAPELIAVITAAAHASLQAGEHIISIVPLERAGDHNIQLLAWSSEGRRQHFGSHKVR